MSGEIHPYLQRFFQDIRHYTASEADNVQNGVHYNEQQDIILHSGMAAGGKCDKKS